jgi:beta-glucosidase
LVSHAKAVDLYRKKYQPAQKGKISMVNVIEWSEPITMAPEDVAAARLRTEFSYDWWLEPLYFGDYPESMRKKLWFLLPKFKDEEKTLLKGSIDYLALNHYTTSYTARPSYNRIDKTDGMASTPITSFVSTHYDINGTLVGDRSSAEWLFDVPWGFKKALMYVHKKYNNPEIYITENGFSVKDEAKAPMESKLNDTGRVKYYAGYLNAIQEAIQEGVTIKSYFSWTLIDNFEWHTGFTVPFGVSIYNRDTKKRYLKDSFFYLRQYFTKAISKKY